MKKLFTVMLALFVALAFAGATVAADNAAKAAPAEKKAAPATDNAAKAAPAADNTMKAPAKPAEKK